MTLKAVAQSEVGFHAVEGSWLVHFKPTAHFFFTIFILAPDWSIWKLPLISFLQYLYWSGITPKINLKVKKCKQRWAPASTCSNPYPNPCPNPYPNHKPNTNPHTNPNKSENSSWLTQITDVIPPYPNYNTNTNTNTNTNPYHTNPHTNANMSGISSWLTQIKNVIPPYPNPCLKLTPTQTLTLTITSRRSHRGWPK